MLLEEIEGALWTRSLLESCRHEGPSDTLCRVVVGVDPPASDRGDECGIVVCALDASGIAQVLADRSVAKASPERRARAVAEAAMSAKSSAMGIVASAAAFSAACAFAPLLFLWLTLDVDAPAACWARRVGLPPSHGVAAT